MSKWQPIETAPKDETHLLLFTSCHGIVEAWFSPGFWSDETPLSPREYTGDVWVCADDAFQIEVELWDGHEDHGTATHWMPLPEPPSDG